MTRAASQLQPPFFDLFAKGNKMLTTDRLHVVTTSTGTPCHSPEPAEDTLWQPDDLEPSSCVLWTDETGVIVDCTDDVTPMFGHRWDQLLGRHISVLLPTMASMQLLHAGAINPLLMFLVRSAIPFRAYRSDGHAGSCRLFARLFTSPSGPVIALTLLGTTR